MDEKVCSINVRIRLDLYESLRLEAYETRMSQREIIEAALDDYFSKASREK